MATLCGGATRLTTSRACAGKKVYSAFFQRVQDYPNATGGHTHATAVGVGYRNDNTSGVAKGDQPETLYMVASGSHYNEGCCFVS
jgi:hypothetical protein|eukprot:COSAG01_NODE_5299_length_4352_cov_2.254879_2_plen_85_part_00